MFDELEKIVQAELDSSKASIQLACDDLKKRNSLLLDLFSNPRLPEEGFDENMIDYILNIISKMDSNNFSKNIGLGEREGRIFSNIVSRRHFYLSHGIGRSGEITESQPKAIGSSFLYRMTNSVVKHAITLAGLHKNTIAECLVLPVATGMSIALCLIGIRRFLPDNHVRNFVLIIRCDQKSALKAIKCAGFHPIIVENYLKNDEITTDLNRLECAIQEVGSENILGVISTTSCFAPRLPENVAGVADVCQKYNLFHIVNNAYGIQSLQALNKISSAVLNDKRIDFVVQSTDKNFMVPVGGSVIFTTKKDSLLNEVAKSYPGRASSSPIVDIFITLLQMGTSGWKRLLEERRQNYLYFRNSIVHVISKFEMSLLSSEMNDISIAISAPKNVCHSLGSALFLRKVSGVRFINVEKKERKIIEGIPHTCYGSHINNYPTSYFTVAIAIGCSQEEIDLFIKKLSSLLKKSLN